MKKLFDRETTFDVVFDKLTMEFDRDDILVFVLFEKPIKLFDKFMTAFDEKYDTLEPNIPKLDNDVIVAPVYVVALTVPDTSNLEPGFATPIPQLLFFIYNVVVLRSPIETPK